MGKVKFHGVGPLTTFEQEVIENPVDLMAAVVLICCINQDETITSLQAVKLGEVLNHSTVRVHASLPPVADLSQPVWV